MGKSIHMLYGRGTVKLQLPENHKCQIIESRAPVPEMDADAIVNHALEHPIESDSLRDLTREAKKVLIITNDHTRPMPSIITIPAIIKSFYHEESYYDITVLIATGLHRRMTRQEMLEQLGEDVCRKYRVVNHIATDKSNLISFGKMSSGKELFLNKLISEKDLIISEGYIEPHFFAGYSGGRKSILPGVAGIDNILDNHSPQNISDNAARQAMLSGNPIHDECTEAALTSGLKFILNVALNKDKQIIAAFAGHPVQAHLAGCGFVEKSMTVDVEKTDIVITSNNGYPLDRNLYQVVKGIDTASKVAKNNGIIIMAAECADQVGHEDFKNLVLSCNSAEELYAKMSIPPSQIDKWQAQVLARILITHKIILVSSGIKRDLAEKMFFIYAETIDQALDMAISMTGESATISVIPEGPVIIPRASNE